MRRLRATSIGVAVLGVTLMMSVSASAETIGVSPGLVTVSNMGSLTIANSIVSWACDLSFTATLASSTSLAEGLTRIGALTSGSASGCVGLSGVEFLGLSETLGGAGWDISLLLPLPTNGDQANIAFLDARWNIAVSGQNCLYEGEMVASLNGAGTMLSFDPANNSLAVDPGSGFICQLGGDMALDGTIRVSPTMTVTLTP